MNSLSAKVLDHLATVIGLIMAAIQGAQIDWVRLLAGDRTEVGKLGSAVAIAIFGLITNKVPATKVLGMVLAVGLLGATAASAQTKPALTQMFLPACPAGQTVNVLVISQTTKAFQCVPIDGSSVVITPAGTLSAPAIPSSVATPTVKTITNEYQIVTADNQKTFTLKGVAGGTVINPVCFLNGLRMTLGYDYNLAGAVITFVDGQSPNAGGIVTCDYQVQQ
jgi:hypothetical protein